MTKPVVLTIHGIRDFGDWQERAKAYLHGRDIVCHSFRYQRFWLARFLTQTFYIQGISSDLASRLREISANGGRINVICHSFGSHLIKKVLLGNPDIKIDHLIMCGSIARHDRSLEHLFHNEQLSRLTCLCGTFDVWPPIASVLSSKYEPTGVLGFGHPQALNKYYATGHGGFLTEEAWNRINLAGLITGEQVEPDRPSRRSWLVYLILRIYNYRSVAAFMTLFIIAAISAIAMRLHPIACYVMTCSYKTYRVISFSEETGHNGKPFFVERKIVSKILNYRTNKIDFTAKPYPGGPNPDLKDLHDLSTHSQTKQGEGRTIALKVRGNVATVYGEWKWPKQSDKNYPGGIGIAPDELVTEYEVYIKLPDGVELKPYKKEAEKMREGLVWYQTRLNPDSGKAEKVPSKPLGECEFIDNGSKIGNKLSCKDMNLTPGSGLIYCFALKGWDDENHWVASDEEECDKFNLN